MPKQKISDVNVERYVINSIFLNRDVLVDFYFPFNSEVHSSLSLLLVNDGQDLITMKFDKILTKLYEQNKINPVMCIGIHCGADRKNEYATAAVLDYAGRGSKAADYTKFVLNELIPFTKLTYPLTSFKDQSFAGFSLGGLSALDIVWGNATQFSKAGIFSGALWWRDKDQADVDFDELQHRIMHRQIREGIYAPDLKFFFEAGAKDETADRNNNGIIDAIDDTLDLIAELKKKGYNDNNITYLELTEGRHDTTTWAIALPDFLKWGWGVSYKL